MIRVRDIDPLKSRVPEGVEFLFTRNSEPSRSRIHETSRRFFEVLYPKQTILKDLVNSDFLGPIF